jgi:hypothetical protein
MKNIHIVPTDNPSRFFITNEKKYGFREHYVPDTMQTIRCMNIYITSDEEIKEGQNYIGDGFSGKNKFKWHKSQVETYPNIKKDVIVLTTDQDLIKDGVQSIDDEFLEWFVNNPSCEEVEIFHQDVYSMGKWDRRCKIIIPKEEPKQHLIDMMKDDEELGLYEEPKQETLEEAAKKYSDDWEEITGLDYDEQVPNFVNKLDFINGAKWQQERSYSENEVLQLLLRLQQTESYDNLYEWFEQFKKK